MNTLRIPAFILTTLGLISLVSLSGCTREFPSDKPPVHLNPNMDNQPKYKAQSKSHFFADSAAMKPPVTGTVARGQLHDDNIYYTGSVKDSQYIDKNPMTLDMPLLKRGRERYDIHCSPCHSRLGDGRGIIVSRGYISPPSFHDDRLRQMPDGKIFDILSNGIRNMSSYRAQVKPEDRWAMVAYIRALQRSQNARLKDIPPEIREKVKP